MSDRTCNEPGCHTTDIIARGLCGPHYRRRRYRGTLPPRTAPTPHAAVTETAHDHGIPVTDIIGAQRHAHIVTARIDAAHRLRRLGLTTGDIGHILGARDHSTILHYLKQPAPQLPDDPEDLGDGCHVPGCHRLPKHPRMAFCPGHDRRWRRTGRVDPDRPLRSFLTDNTVLDIDIHDRTGYRNGCRCNRCRTDAVRAVKNNRLKPQTRPVDQAADEVQRLIDAGMTVADIVRASGVCRATIDRWLRRVGRARQPTIDRIRAVVPPEHIPEPDGSAICEDCRAPSLGGGRWCLTCFKANAAGQRFHQPTAPAPFMPLPEWATDARCVDADPETFFPRKGGDVKPALTICQSCPVIEPCRELAIERGETFGVWGGLTAQQLKRSTNRYQEAC